MPYVRSFLVLTSVLALVPPLSGQAPDTTRLGEIVVTATRTPAPLRTIGSSADLLRAAELTRRQIESLRDALRLVPGGGGLLTGAPGAVTSLFLRGVSSTQTLFLVDGIRVNDANTSFSSFLGGADLGGLGQLELVRGPQSTLYGGAAIGGVVSLDAAPGQGRGRGTADLEAGSFGTWRGAAEARGSRGGFGFNLAASANAADNQRRPNDWDQRTQLVRLDYSASDQFSVGGTFRGLQSEYSSPGDIRTTNTTPVGVVTYENNLATLWLEAHPVSPFRSRLIAGGQEQFSRSVDRFDGGPESAFSVSNSRRVLDWQNTLTLGSGAVLVAGANREWSTVWTTGTSQDERLLAFYAQAQVNPVPALTVTAGARNDDYNSFGSAWTWRATAAWQFPVSGTKLRASAGTGFMPPGLSARFGGDFQGPNPDIRPERSRGWDAGIDQSFWSGRGVLGVTWFRNDLRDLIGFEGAIFPALGKSINIDRARTSGLEVGGRVNTGVLDARLAYTLLSARSLSEPDPALSRLIRRPRHNLVVDVGVAATARTVIGGGIEVVRDREDTDFNTFPSARVDPGDYAILRLYGSFGVGARLVLRARIENLGDKSYEPAYGFPALGRTFIVSAGLRF